MNLHSKRHLAAMRSFRAILSADGETRPANRTTIRMRSSARSRSHCVLNLRAEADNDTYSLRSMARPVAPKMTLTASCDDQSRIGIVLPA